MKPRKIQIKKPVKLIFIGGFLGSGKTTAIADLARRLIDRGMKVGIVTNDQSENLVDTVIVKQMLSELNVPVEEVVKGCFCCQFDDLINHLEKILAHDPDLLLGEPVGSCTDFVAAVANPIKIHYGESFRFAPFSTLVDPDRLRELMLDERKTSFPQEVSYLFKKQLEEADIIVLNKIDLLPEEEADRLMAALKAEFAGKRLLAVSARKGLAMKEWLDLLMAGSPGAESALARLDYDRYARAEAVLGWLNGAIRFYAEQEFDSALLLIQLAEKIRADLTEKGAGIGHLKFVMTGGKKSMWASLTSLEGRLQLSDIRLGNIAKGAVMVNARVRLAPEVLEAVVKNSIEKTSDMLGIDYEIIDIQSFSPAYPAPPYLVRERKQDVKD